MNATHEQLRRYSECVFNADDVIELRVLPVGTSSWPLAGQLADVGAQFLRLNRAGQTPYVGVNPRQAVGGRSAADVGLARCVFVDFDHVDEADARRRIDATGLPVTTLLVNSGHGIHAFWRLTAPILELADWSAVQRRLIAALDSDTSIHDAPRVMRAPGFLNCKRKPYVPCDVIEADPQRRHTLASIVERLPELAPIVTQSAPLPQTSALPASDYAVLRAARYIGRIPGAVAGQHGHDRTFHAACVLLRFGLTPAQAWPLLVQWNTTCQPPWPEHDLRRKLAEAEKHAHDQRGKKGGSHD